MKWFKFYGQDFLTDSRIGSLNPLQKLMWVGLLCIASQDEERTGVIKFLTEERLKELCGIIDSPYDDDYKRTNGTLETFCNMELVTMPDENTIIIKNFNKKQTQQATSTERVRDWRAKNKAVSKTPKKVRDVTNETNVTLQSNGRIEESRIDINTKVEDDESSSLKVSNKEVTTLLPNDVNEEFTVVETDEDGNEKRGKWGSKPRTAPNAQKWPVARVAKTFEGLCHKHLGTRPTGHISVLKAIQRAFEVHKMTEDEINDLFDEWFSLGKPDEVTIHIRQALSDFNINRYRVVNQ